MVKVSAIPRNRIAFLLGVLTAISVGVACAQEGDNREVNMQTSAPVVLTVYSDYV